MTLTEFLLARIAEDEAVAKATESDHFVAYVDDCDWHVEAEGVSHLANFGRETWPLVGEQVAHIARHDPARVLAECEAKRRIVAWHESWPVMVETQPEFETVGADASSMAFSMSQKIAWLTTQEYRARFGDEPPSTPMLRALAAVYSDHPDFDEAWRA